MFSFLSDLFSIKKESPPKDENTYFHGMNLSEWNYLGYAILSYVDKEGETNAEAYVYFFEHMEEDKREYKVVSTNQFYSFETHGFILKIASLWKIFEKESHQAISYPSSKLKEQMKEIDYEWNAAEATWKKIKKYEASENSNVVTLMK